MLSEVLSRFPGAIADASSDAPGLIDAARHLARAYADRTNKWSRSADRFFARDGLY
jgi:hypothetical protein